MNRHLAIVALSLTSAIGATACSSRQHLYRGAGEAKAAAFRTQVDLRGETRPPRPLSSVDAEINLQNYQATFARHAGHSTIGAGGSNLAISSDSIGTDLPPSSIQSGHIQLQAK
jgi:hypothetical protein